jgi:hypothetical protein
LENNIKPDKRRNTGKKVEAGDSEVTKPFQLVVLRYTVKTNRRLAVIGSVCALTDTVSWYLGSSSLYHIILMLGKAIPIQACTGP